MQTIARPDWNKLFASPTFHRYLYVYMQNIYIHTYIEQILEDVALPFIGRKENRKTINGRPHVLGDRLYTCMHIIHTHTHTHTHTHVCMYACMYVCMYVYIYIYIYVYIYIHTYIYMYCSLTAALLILYYCFTTADTGEVAGCASNERQYHCLRPHRVPPRLL